MNLDQKRSITDPQNSRNQPRGRRAAFYFLLFASATLNSTYTSTARADQPRLEPFQFVQICDTQLGFGAAGYDADIESFRQAVRQINKMKPDFVVICGDLVNKPEPKAFADFKEVLAEFTVPCHCAAGNHDIGHPLNPSLLANYRETIGKDYYHFKHKGYTFAVVNTQLWKSPAAPETAQQDTWFTRTLREAKKQNSPVFVVGHHPLFLEAANEKEEYFNIPSERRKQVLDLFSEHGVVAMLTGHTHKMVSNTHQGIQFLSGETTSKNFDKRPLGFRVWTVDSPQRISHRFVPLSVVRRSAA